MNRPPHIKTDEKCIFMYISLLIFPKTSSWQCTCLKQKQWVIIKKKPSVMTKTTPLNSLKMAIWVCNRKRPLNIHVLIASIA